MGRYPVRSMVGNEYVMTSVYNGFIYVTTMKNRSKEQIIKAYMDTHDYFKKHGHIPMFQHLNNESSNDLKTYFNAQNIDFQFCDKDRKVVGQVRTANLSGMFIEMQLRNSHT